MAGMNNISDLKKTINDNYRKTRNKHWPCFYAQCNNPSIGSHSQSVSTSLRSIAEDGHVMERNPSFFTIRERQGWRKIGVNKATKFPGFCKTHDNKLFKQADSISEKNLTPKALSHLSYRTFAMEMRKKEIYAELMKDLLKHSDKFIDHNAEGIVRNIRGGMLNCLKVTKPFFFMEYQAMIESKDYTRMAHKIYRSDRNVGVSCATAINPLDTTEQPIDKPQPLICFNVLPRKKYTFIIFSYPRPISTLIEMFIRNNERLENLVFNYCEEVILKISLYDSLDSQTVDKIEMAQAPWTFWQEISIPDMFDFKLNDDSLWREV